MQIHKYADTGNQKSSQTAQSQGKNLWDLGIVELTGKNVEAAGREEVNELLQNGWILLHIYTLKYLDEKDGNVWRERPMVILGRPGN